MRKIKSLDELNIPYSYKMFIRLFLANLSNLDGVVRVILFGSSARGEVDEQKSDLDLFVITENDLSPDEEYHIMSDCAPSYDSDHYIPSDIIVNSLQHYNQFKDRFGMVQKQIEREGVDLSELL